LRLRLIHGVVDNFYSDGMHDAVNGNRDNLRIGLLPGRDEGQEHSESTDAERYAQAHSI
jgi:hypothetical protein